MLHCSIGHFGVVTMSDSIAILIPAYQPGETLIRLVDELLSKSDYPIVIVNDGSDPQCQPIFDALKQRSHVQVIAHAINLGKGQALKTGFNHCLTHFSERLAGVVTADADGQHLATDIINLASKLELNPSVLWIGSRAFDKDVPWKSQLGNTATRHVFRLLIGKVVHDTQSGLRGIPASFMRKLLKIPATGYEFELDMLVSAAQNQLTIQEHPIQTVYIANNQSSHFHPLLDSLRVYFVFVRFCALSLLTALLDFIVFTIAFFISPSILSSMIIARVVAGSFNFMCGKWYIFQSKQRLLPEAIKFALLVVGLGIIAYSFIEGLVGLGMNVFLSKLLVETGLFLLSFSVQRIFIFKESENNITNIA